MSNIRIKDITDPLLVRGIKDKTVSTKELANYLTYNFTIGEIAETLADILINSDDAQPIAITEEQFNAHFRIIGQRLVDGKVIKETRGRKSK